MPTLMSSISSLSLTLTLLSSPLALAQEPTPAPTPAGQDEDTFWHPERPTYLVPSLGLAMGWSKRIDNNPQTLSRAHHPTAWLGLALHPQAGKVSPFVSLGLEIEHHSFERGGSATYYMPTMRLGTAWQTTCYDAKSDEINFVTSMLPCVTLYGIAGVRPTLPNQAPYLRMGVGVNFLSLTLVGALFGVLLPGTLEAIIETDMQGSSIQMFRLGYGF